MRDDLARIVAARVTEVHQLVLTVASSLSEEQLSWRPAGVAPGTAPPIRWHLWHVARWADVVQAGIPGLAPDLGRRLGPGRQLWDAEDLATRWGLVAEALGQKQTGWGLDDNESARLELPNKDTLLEYARRTFAAADRAIAAVGDREFPKPCVDLYGRERPVGDAVLSHMSHVNRHLGMMEAMRGAIGVPGTATV